MITIVESTTGHRSLPHTADVILEAWAPTLGGCIAEAVRALVEEFVEPVGGVEPASRDFAVDSTDEAGALVAVLEEVIYVTEVEGVVPVDVSVDSADGAGVRGTLSIVGLGDVVQVGSVPKAVSWRDLDVARSSAGWRCRVTIDV
jgi:SHS2 domain-containing protein